MLFAPCVRAFCALAVRRRHGARGARQLHRVNTRMTACGACFSFNLSVSLYLSVFSRICCSCLIARRPEQSALRAATVGGVETLATRRALTLLRCPSSVPRLIYTVCLLVRGAFFFFAVRMLVHARLTGLRAGAPFGMDAQAERAYIY